MLGRHKYIHEEKHCKSQKKCDKLELLDKMSIKNITAYYQTIQTMYGYQLTIYRRE